MGGRIHALTKGRFRRPRPLRWHSTRFRKAPSVARLQSAPGVGKRTAERIIVELREKVDVALPEQVITVTRRDDPRALARDGLLELGYSAQEADALLDGVTGERAEDLIAEALRTARK